MGCPCLSLFWDEALTALLPTASQPSAARVLPLYTFRRVVRLPSRLQVPRQLGWFELLILESNQCFHFDVRRNCSWYREAAATATVVRAAFCLHRMRQQRQEDRHRRVVNDPGSVSVSDYSGASARLRKIDFRGEHERPAKKASQLRQACSVCEYDGPHRPCTTHRADSASLSPHDSSRTSSPLHVGRVFGSIVFFSLGREEKASASLCSRRGEDGRRVQVPSQSWK